MEKCTTFAIQASGGTFGLFKSYFVSLDAIKIASGAWMPILQPEQSLASSAKLKDDLTWKL